MQENPGFFTVQSPKRSQTARRDANSKSAKDAQSVSPKSTAKPPSPTAVATAKENASPNNPSRKTPSDDDDDDDGDRAGALCTDTPTDARLTCTDTDMANVDKVAKEKACETAKPAKGIITDHQPETIPMEVEIKPGKLEVTSDSEEATEDGTSEGGIVTSESRKDSGAFSSDAAALWELKRLVCGDTRLSKERGAEAEAGDSKTNNESSHAFESGLTPFEIRQSGIGATLLCYLTHEDAKVLSTPKDKGAASSQAHAVTAELTSPCQSPTSHAKRDVVAKRAYFVSERERLMALHKRLKTFIGVFVHEREPGVVDGGGVEDIQDDEGMLSVCVHVFL